MKLYIYIISLFFIVVTIFPSSQELDTTSPKNLLEAKIDEILAFKVNLPDLFRKESTRNYSALFQTLDQNLQTLQREKFAEQDEKINIQNNSLQYVLTRLEQKIKMLESELQADRNNNADILKNLENCLDEFINLKNGYIDLERKIEAFQKNINSITTTFLRLSDSIYLVEQEQSELKSALKNKRIELEPSELELGIEEKREKTRAEFLSSPILSSHTRLHAKEFSSNFLKSQTQLQFKKDRNPLVRFEGYLGNSDDTSYLKTPKNNNYLADLSSSSSGLHNNANDDDDL